MQFEVIIPLIAYLVVVFGLSLYAMRKRASGSFLNEYFLGSRSMGGFVLAMTLTATYISASSFIGGPGAAYKYGLGWVLLAMIQLPAIWLSLACWGKNSPSLRVAIMLSPSMTCCLRAIRVACWSGWPA
ncbi:sodium/panthothenate symporter [Klebsiella pneumoniae subsp. pneumoniae]|nr:sodium/panthothenate symporter [Klebsiella pneumoniae subsp. pneumoniae]